MLYQLGATIAWILLRWRIQIAGEENIPSKGPLIIVANHQSYADGIFLAVIFRSLFRLHFLGKKELFFFFTRWILKGWNVHPLNREGIDKYAMNLCLNLLETEQKLVMLPEGTRSKNGTLQEGRTGVAYLALKTGAPVLPIGIEWTGRNLLKILFTFPRITISIGTPITVQKVEGKPSKEITNDTLKSIMDSIAAQLPDKQRGTHNIRTA